MGKINRNESERLKKLFGDDVDEKSDDFFSTSRKSSKKDAEQSQSDIDPIATIKELLSPTLHKIRLKYKYKFLPKIKKLIASFGPIRLALSGVVVLFLVVGFGLVRGASNSNNDTSSVQGVSSEAAIEAPFEVLEAPDNAQPARYDSEKKVSNFQDSLEGKRLVVSQQQVPENKIDNEFFVFEVAQSFNIDKEFPSDKGGVFIGENQEQQVQTAIFRSNDVLVFIQIESIVNPNTLIEYINNL